MKHELGGKIVTEFVALRPRTYSYLTDDIKDVKNAKRPKKCVIKEYLSLMVIKTSLFKNEIILKPQQR